MIPAFWLLGYRQIRRHHFVHLCEKTVDFKKLQRFAGKCISTVLAVPAARLLSREVNKAISNLSRNSKNLHIYKELREELEF